MTSLFAVLFLLKVFLSVGAPSAWEPSQGTLDATVFDGDRGGGWDPDGLTSDDDRGGGWDPNGVESDRGLGWDPDGAQSDRG